jgi:hypothetical protein
LTNDPLPKNLAEIDTGWDTKRMRHRVAPLIALVMLIATALAAPAAESVVVYPHVPGLSPSAHYAVRVRAAGAGSAWQTAFAWESKCKGVEKGTDAYFTHLANWTHTYVNFETTGRVEVEIARVGGEPIRTATIHPQRLNSKVVTRQGKAYVSLAEPGLITVDIDGQMDEQDTGKGYRGPPLHTISLFANPPLKNKPRPDDPGVRTVQPGESPPREGTWTTLYFLPGVHDVGLAFELQGNRNYYIPGDAIVYGTLANTTWGEGRNVRIFGHGTLSGARLKHPKYATPVIAEDRYHSYRPIEVLGAKNVVVEGITIDDAAYHALMLVHPYQEEEANVVTWTKIITWRANGDGINPFGNTLIEDCFLRTQDDSLYVNGRGIRRVVLWNDANGSSFVLSSIAQVRGRTLVVEDCDVIYSRATWHHWSGGRVFNMRGEGAGAGGDGVVFRNIRIEDPRPTLQQFFLCNSVGPPYAKQPEQRGAGDISGVVFQNISIAAPSVLGEPQLLLGQANAKIRGLIFENLTVSGKRVVPATFFHTNEYVSELSFLPHTPLEK